MDKLHFSARKRITPTGPWVYLKRLLGIYPIAGDVPESRARIERPLAPEQARPERSFAALLPWQRFDPEYRQLVCADGKQRAVAIEITPTDVEARPDQELHDVADKISIALKTLPEHELPWIVQCYIQNESARSLSYRLHQYIHGHLRENTFSTHWLAVVEQHLAVLCRRRGIFVDGKTDLAWRARFRRVRVILYRERGARPAHPEELNAVAIRFSDALREAGILTRVLNGEQWREWLLPWLSGEGDMAYPWLAAHPYPVEEEMQDMLPPGFDLAELCLKGRSVRADFEANTWRFGRRLNRYITLQPVRIVPRPGHIMLEATSKAAMFDRLPEGAIVNMTFAVEPADLIERRLLGIVDAAIGESPESTLAKQQCQEALEWMARGRRLIGWSAGIYLNADSLPVLARQTTRAISAADAAGLSAIDPEDDLFRLDSYVRNLPMKFSPGYDAEHGQRARSMWHEHAARLLPFYGRGSGTGHMGCLLFNRVGEPLSFDPLNEQDRSKNAHLLLLGPTGSGKTAMLVKLLLQTVAVHRPRLFIVTALPTFGLLGDYFKKHGLSVNYVTINPGEDVSLPPFADIGLLHRQAPQAITPDDEEGYLERDILGEAEIAAKLMITGGDREEEKRFTRSHRTILRNAIMRAARGLAEPGAQALTEDIVRALNETAKNDCENQQQARIAQTMAKAMELYCSGIEGQLFNRPGRAWPDVDVTIVELGILARKGYEDKMAVAVTGLMARINSQVEQHQDSARHTIACFDEAHMQVQNPLVAPYMNSISAMWRTYGAWLWLSTQNLHQFPDESRQLLAQPEWWLCMSTDEDDVNQIARFKNLSAEQKALLKSAHKESGKYTEGVVMSKKLLALFRNVPPSIALSLGQTEKHEKARRRQLMRLHRCDALTAAELIAAEIDKQRGAFGGGQEAPTW